MWAGRGGFRARHVVFFNHKSTFAGASSLLPVRNLQGDQDLAVFHILRLPAWLLMA